MPCTLGMRWGLCTCSSREVAVLQLSVVVGRVLEAGSACDSCVWGGGWTGSRRLGASGCEAACCATGCCKESAIHALRDEFQDEASESHACGVPVFEMNAASRSGED